MSGEMLIQHHIKRQISIGRQYILTTFISSLLEFPMATKSQWTKRLVKHGYVFRFWYCKKTRLMVKIPDATNIVIDFHIITIPKQLFFFYILLVKQKLWYMKCNVIEDVKFILIICGRMQSSNIMRLALNSVQFHVSPRKGH